MAEPLKNLFNTTIIKGMGDHLAKASSAFDQSGFVAAAVDGLESLELKERSDQITEALAAFLPADFAKAADVLLTSLAPDHDEDIAGATVDERGIAGWAILPMTHYVGLHGQDHIDLSLSLLKEMTKRFTSEYGIRFFLLEQTGRTLSTLESWLGDPSRHVRRLISEGTRPRLPWAMQLPAFIADPSPVLPLLAALKDDKEEYVRRSVANNLNDIAKDHPDLIAGIAEKWLAGAPQERKKLVRHACRTLIKQGHKATLKALGFAAPDVVVNNLKILTPNVEFGSALAFELSLASTGSHDQPLIIDYVVHHRKANGGTSPKVFKWKMMTLKPKAEVSLKKKHPMRNITTRAYYPGTHRLEILVNGEKTAGAEFELTM